MAKSKALIASEARVAELEARVAELEARLENAKGFFRAQREEIAALKAGAAIAVAQRSASVQPVVTRWTDNQGRVWEKTRIGAKASSRLVDEVAPEAAHHD